MYRKMCHFVEVQTVVFYLSPGQLIVNKQRGLGRLSF